MSVDFEKVNDRVQRLERENKELHDRLDYFISGQDKPKHNDVSFTWSEEKQQTIVESITREALHQSQAQVLESVSFMRKCLYFTGITAIAGAILTVIVALLGIEATYTSIKDSLQAK